MKDVQFTQMFMCDGKRKAGGINHSSQNKNANTQTNIRKEEKKTEKTAVFPERECLAG